MKEVKFESGRIIIAPGAPIDRFYKIKSGNVITTETKRVYTPGSYIGIFSFFTGIPLAEGYMASTDVVLVEFDENGLAQLNDEKEFEKMMNFIARTYVNTIYNRIFGSKPSDLVENVKKLIETLNFEENIDLVDSEEEDLEFDEEESLSEVELTEDTDEAYQIFIKFLDEGKSDTTIAKLIKKIIKKFSNDSNQIMDLVVQMYSEAMGRSHKDLTNFLIRIVSIYVDDFNILKDFHKNHLEFLRFIGDNTWGEQIVRAANVSYLQEITGGEDNGDNDREG